jgi:hypothetical protein
MRCSICDSFTTGGSISAICETCQEIIDSNVVCMEETNINYSVIPSETDIFGRVLTNGRHPKNDY